MNLTGGSSSWWWLWWWRGWEGGQDNWFQKWKWITQVYLYHGGYHKYDCEGGQRRGCIPKWIWLIIIDYLSGRPITATEAASYGLVSKVFPVEHLVEEAVKTADHIAGLSQVSDDYSDDIWKLTLEFGQLSFSIHIILGCFQKPMPIAHMIKNSRPKFL